MSYHINLLVIEIIKWFQGLGIIRITTWISFKQKEMKKNGVETYLLKSDIMKTSHVERNYSLFSELNFIAEI